MADIRQVRGEALLVTGSLAQGFPSAALQVTWVPAWPLAPRRWWGSCLRPYSPRDCGLLAGVLSSARTTV